MTQLMAEITLCETLKESDYTADSWRAFNEELNFAKATVSNKEATDDDMMIAFSLLNESRNSLVEVGV